jgi:hypothetical protein
MLTGDIHVGKRYGFRENPRSRDDLIEVEIIEVVGRGGHIKVRHRSGMHPGLTEYVKSRQLMVPWNARKAFLRDEQRLRRVQELSNAYGHPVREAAIDTVFEATGYPSLDGEHSGRQPCLRE